MPTIRFQGRAARNAPGIANGSPNTPWASLMSAAMILGFSSATC